MRLQPFKQPVARPRIPSPDQSPWYWTPYKVGAYPAPEWFREKVREVDPDGLISINWNPVKERWQVWYRKENVARTGGWVLLFVVQDPDGSYRPLDERLLSRLYQASAAKWGNGKRYFDAIQREMEREKEQRDRARNDEVAAGAREQWDFSQIKNIGSGSKFSNFHSE